MKYILMYPAKCNLKITPYAYKGYIREGETHKKSRIHVRSSHLLTTCYVEIQLLKHQDSQ